MTDKQADLMRLPLWECPECHRLEFSEIRVECPHCAGMFEIERGADHVFEAIGQHFYRDTGYLRPGKDDCRGVHSDEERWAAFEKWKRGE